MIKLIYQRNHGGKSRAGLSSVVPYRPYHDAEASTAQQPSLQSAFIRRPVLNRQHVGQAVPRGQCHCTCRPERLPQYPAGRREAAGVLPAAGGPVGSEREGGRRPAGESPQEGQAPGPEAQAHGRRADPVEWKAFLRRSRRCSDLPGSAMTGDFYSQREQRMLLSLFLALDSIIFYSII